MALKTNYLSKYKKAIKKQYLVSTNGYYGDFLLQLTRAKLRDLCIEKLKNANEMDVQLISLFVGFDLKNASQVKWNQATDKFRTIENFLKDKNDVSDITTLNVAAILVDYENRPFQKFCELNIVDNDDKSKKKIEINKDLNNTKDYFFSKYKNKIISGISILGLTILGNQYFFPKKECMQWTGTKYEMVDCSKEIKSLYSENEIIPIDEKQIELKKIEVNSSTMFFKNNKPCVWYIKVNGNPEFYNNFGFHPVSGKPLKPITKYMINKWVKQKNLTIAR